MVNHVFGGTSGSGGYTLRYHVAELSHVSRASDRLVHRTIYVVVVAARRSPPRTRHRRT